MPPGSMGTVRSLFLSSVGRKALAAATGACLLLFVVVHMLGGLRVFLGPDAVNAYAHRLRQLPGLLWTVRLGLAAALILHVQLVSQIALENRRARPVGYVTRRTLAATPSSRVMMWTGGFVLAFVVLHLAHFTLGLTHPEYLRLRDPLGRPDVYRMILLGFRQWEYCIAYVAGVALLAGHLGHAVPSLFQTLGWHSPRIESGLRRFGLLLAAAIFAGYAAVPTAVAFDLLDLPGEP